MSATALVNPESFIAVSILLPELAATPRPPQVSRVRARPQKNNRYASPPPRTPPAISRSRKNQRNPTSIETCSGRRRSSPANTSWTRTVTRSAHRRSRDTPADSGRSSDRDGHRVRHHLVPLGNRVPSCPQASVWDLLPYRGAAVPRRTVSGPRRGRVPAQRSGASSDHQPLLQRLPVFQDRFDVAQPSRLRAVCAPVAPPTPGSASRSVLSQARVVGFAARHSSRWVSLHVDCRSSVSRTWRCWRRRRS